MKSKKRLICSICAVFMIAFSLFLIPFSQVDSASADSVSTEYVFEGSNIYFPVSYVDQNTGAGLTLEDVPIVTPFSFDIKLQKTSIENFTVSLYGFSMFGGQMDVEYNNYIYWTSSFTFNFSQIGSGNIFQFPVTKGNSPIQTIFNPYYLKAWVTCSSDSFIPNIYKARIYSTRNVSAGVGTNNIRYYDVNENYIDFGFYVYYPSGNTGYSTGLFVEDRTYLLNESLSENQYFQSGYDEGYNNGYNSGLDFGYNDGYNSGFTNGENTGFSNGYEEGLNTANSYTFMSLIGSTIDAPIKAFRGLFNFELLGVNMVSLITGLFTLCVIVCIVKLVLGGK